MTSVFDLLRNVVNIQMQCKKSPDLEYPFYFIVQAITFVGGKL